MKKVCCSDLFKALIEHRDHLEWTPVSDGDEAGPLVVGWFEKTRVMKSPGFLPAMWCPFCEAQI